MVGETEFVSLGPTPGPGTISFVMDLASGSQATLDLFDATGNKISPEERCPVTATATRFE